MGGRGGTDSPVRFTSDHGRRRAQIMLRQAEQGPSRVQDRLNFLEALGDVGGEFDLEFGLAPGIGCAEGD